MNLEEYFDMLQKMALRQKKPFERNDTDQGTSRR